MGLPWPSLESSADEHRPNSASYVVLFYAYWHSHFEDDPSVVGRVVRLNRHPFTILGVTPPGFQGTALFFAPDIFLPVVNHEQLTAEDPLQERGSHWMFEMVGRLKFGVTPGAGHCRPQLCRCVSEKELSQRRGQ